MANPSELRTPRRVHFAGQDDPSQRKALDRKSAEQRAQNVTIRVASSAISASASSSQRAAVGTDKQTPLHLALSLSNGAVPKPGPLKPATPLRRTSLGPPRRVPVKQTPQKPTRVSPGERR